MALRRDDNYSSKPRKSVRNSSQLPASRYSRHEQGSDASSYSRSAYDRSGSGNSSSYGYGQYDSVENYSRRSAASSYTARRAKGSRGKKIFFRILIALVALLAIGGIAAAVYLHSLDAALNDDVDEATEAALSDASYTEPFYVLILGVDRSEARDASGEFGDCYRSDSMILARIDPVEKQVTLISIERDTLVDLGEHGEQKINTACAYGGPALAVETVSTYAGVPISHYVEVDFDGFEAIVDALGGVTVDVPITINDEEAGGYIEAGEQTLTGAQALVLCRSRHAYDDIGGGDYYRAANQRMVIGACAKQLLASDATTILNTISTACEYISTDMKASDLVALAMQMKDMDTDSIYSSMNPTYSYYDGQGWYEYTNMEAWQAMMERVDAGLSPTINEEDSANRGGVTDGTINPEYVANSVLNDTSDESNQPEPTGIAVWNGCGIAGSAGVVAQSLIDAGFVVDTENDVCDADSYDYANTLIIYKSSVDSDVAETLAEVIGVGMVEEDDGTYDFDTAYLVIVGQDY